MLGRQKRLFNGAGACNVKNMIYALAIGDAKDLL